jgi:hypothetical protein
MNLQLNSLGLEVRVGSVCENYEQPQLDERLLGLYPELQWGTVVSSLGLRTAFVGTTLSSALPPMLAAQTYKLLS